MPFSIPPLREQVNRPYTASGARGHLAFPGANRLSPRNIVPVRTELGRAWVCPFHVRPVIGEPPERITEGGPCGANFTVHEAVVWVLDTGYVFLVCDPRPG